MSIDTARSGLQSSLLYIGSFVKMGVLVQFQRAGFLLFCQLFKKPSHPKKPTGAKKAESSKKASASFLASSPVS